MLQELFVVLKYTGFHQGPVMMSYIDVFQNLRFLKYLAYVFIGEYIIQTVALIVKASQV
jgi:surface polysaccharide O-acyltransferase-like enzyme